jgi:hypothetical protein
MTSSSVGGNSSNCREEQSRVIRFALDVARDRQLSRDKLSELARYMADSNDPVEAPVGPS